RKRADWGGHCTVPEVGSFIRRSGRHSALPMRRLEALAKQVRMSSSAFHLGFKSMTAMSPLQYQKRLRLPKARRLRLGAGLAAAEAAFQVGYESPSQFSREY